MSAWNRTLICALGLLGVAVGCGQPVAQRVNIVDFGPDGNIRGWRPSQLFSDPAVVNLATAVQKGDLVEVDRLVAAGTDVNNVGKDGVTPLGWALMVRNKPAYRRLLEHGADPNRIMATFWPIVEIVASDKQDSEWLELVLCHILIFG